MAEFPKYKIVYEALRKQIVDKTFVPGNLLPSENQLCAEYGVTRPTIRKALDQLVSDGFIIRHQGKGSIVKGAPKSLGILSLSGTTTAVGKESLHTVITIKPEIRPWKDAFGYPLDEQEQSCDCIYFERMRFLDGISLFFDITMLPNIDLPNFATHDLENRSLFEFLRTQYQIEVTGGTQQLFAIKADKRLQDHFNVKAGYPILQLNRKIETNRAGFHIYSQVFCVTHGYGLTGTF